MKKNLFILAVVVGAFLAVFLLFDKRSTEERQPGNQPLAQNYKDATYIINGQAVTLKDGVSEVEAAPGSASKIVTRYFGNEVRHDLDGDGRVDVAFLLTQETGGSGTFFYVAAALNRESGFVGSQGLFLGDRIAPQTTEVSKNPRHENVIVVNYAERALGESFATPPSVGKSIWLRLDTKTMQFGEVVKDFEGEADPSKMTLGMKTWKWIFTIYNNDKKVTPKEAASFTITFKDNGTFSATTDCNSIGGKYSAELRTLSFSEMFGTLMYCEGSQEADFVGMLRESDNYTFTSRGELVLGLKFDSGSVIFR